MTLVVIVANEWGIWQCADHLLSLPASGKKHAFSWKSLHIDCTNGGMLVGFSGVGAALETLSHHQGLVVDWLRGVVRGETRTLNDTIDWIHKQANIVLAPKFVQWSKHPDLRNLEHTFVFGVFEEKTPHILTSSFTVAAGEFVRREHPIQDGGSYWIIGVADAVKPTDIETLDRVCRLPPSSNEDFKRLLAEINKRASKRNGAISEACSTTHLAPAGVSSDTTPFFHEGADLNLPVQPVMMMNGVDPTDWFQNAMDEISAELEQGVSLDDIELSVNEDLLESGSKTDTRLAKPKKNSR